MHPIFFWLYPLMRDVRKILGLAVAGFWYLLPAGLVSAHCPLCVLATGALALLAASLGLSSATVGVVTGGFALAAGFWAARLIHNKTLPYQDAVVTGLVFITTVIPVMPLAREYKPLFLPFIGAYGTTIAVDLFLWGSLLGGLMVLVSPAISRMWTTLTGLHVPFQRIITSIICLALAAVLFEVIIIYA